LKAIPLSRCPKVTVARVESDDAVAWTEAHLNNSIRYVVGLVFGPFNDRPTD